MIHPSRCTNSHCLPLPLSSTGPDCPRQAYPWGLSTQGRGGENNCLPLLVWLQNGTAWALEQGGGGSCGHFFNPAQQALCVSLAHSFHPQCSLMRESGCWHSCHSTFNRLGMKKKVFLAEPGSLVPPWSPTHLCLPFVPHTQTHGSPNQTRPRAKQQRMGNLVANANFCYYYFLYFPNQHSAFR